MQGEKQIIAARKQGYKPSAIFFRVGFELPKVTSSFEKPENALATKQYPEVWIWPSEVGTRLDMRFSTGCRLHVYGESWTDAFIGFIERLAQVNPVQIVAMTAENADMMIYENEKWGAYADSGC